MRSQELKLLPLLFIACFCMLISNVSLAQTEVAFGVKAGASFSGFRGDDAGNVSLRKGVAAGLFLAVSPAEYFTIQPEILFQQKGWVSIYEELNIKKDVKIGYLVIPVLFKLRLPIREEFFPHIYMGPQFSYKLNSEYTIETLDLGEITDNIDLRNYDLGGVFGFGLDVELNHLFINTDFRYGLSALDIDKDNNVKLKNKDIAIMMGIGYIF